MRVKIGIIRCQEFSSRCAGFHCFPAIYKKSGEFQRYDSIEVVGFDTCGGCGRGKADKIVSRALNLKRHGAEVIHLGNCMVAVCPSKDLYIKELQARAGLPVVERTHEKASRPVSRVAESNKETN